MTRIDITAVYRAGALDDYPKYDADYRVDDAESPTVVTILSTETAERTGTAWISCGVDHAIPMESIR